MGKRDNSARRQTCFSIDSSTFLLNPAIFRPQVVPDEKKRVVARVKQNGDDSEKRLLCCAECDKWEPDGPGSYGYSLDGTKHYYGTCRVTGLPCKDNHFCGYATLRKE